MSTFLFLATTSAEILALCAVIFSIVFPQRRAWPPLHKGAAGGRAMQLLFTTSGVGIFLLGINDRNTFILPEWVQAGVGVPLWLAGNLLAAWAVAVLGLGPTFGRTGGLVMRGPYRFSRNPQYVGFILGLAGWALMTNSTLTIIASLAGIPALLAAPFAEEGPLRDKLGQEYIDYLLKVPRFIGW